MQRHRQRNRQRPLEAELDIEAVGARGDGIGRLNGAPVYVARTVPGDRVRARLGDRRGDGIAAEALEVLRPGAGRVAPPCRHFQECGGCALQHWRSDDYAAWKRNLVEDALAHRGIRGIAIGPLAGVPPASRRRASLAAKRVGQRLLLGFHRRASHQVVNIEACLILSPGLAKLLPALRQVLESVVKEGADAQIVVTQTESGIDLVLGCRGPLDLAAREALAEFANREDLARLSWMAQGDPPEPVAHRRPALVRFGGTAVSIPPGGFLQPSLEGEAALTANVLEALKGCRRIADLYSGCGTFSFALAHRSQVQAFDGDAKAIAALRNAARAAGLTERVTAAARDLAAHPLSGHELRTYDGVVFDPPRAGAREQARELARSPVPVVVAVSCDPATFARDARILIDGGYRLLEVAPVDQFPWTSHLELTAVFRR
jgi:23S rRNA (uracil1939-C5)-methyltransferase